MMRTALVIIDIQNDYFPGGKMELVGSLEAGQKAKILLDYFRQTGQSLVFIQHLAARPGATFFIPNTEGVEIHPSIQPKQNETVIQKHYPNSFRETALLDHLRQNNIERLVVCGMMTHMCVDATTRAAFDFGFNCTIAGDACATRDLQYEGQDVPAEYVHGSFLAALQGTYGDVMATADVISSLE